MNGSYAVPSEDSEDIEEGIEAAQIAGSPTERPH